MCNDKIIITMKSLRITCFLLIISLSMSAQVYTVTSCNDLNLYPVNTAIDSEGNIWPADKSIISIYLEGDPNTGIGGLGCWAHHHPNGKDFVVTPYGWGRTPGPGKMMIIREAMQAITDSRTEYDEIGTMNMKLYYLLNDVFSGIYGSKWWLYDTEQCWMTSGIADIRRLSPDERKQVFAHEIGHCFVEDNAPATSGRIGIVADLDDWVDEGVAEYLSSEVYKRTDLEDEYAIDYDFDTPFYDQDYNSYVLFRYYALLYGRPAIVPLIRGIVEGESLGARIQHLQRTGFDEIFHEFLFDWTYNKIEDSGGHKKIPKIDEGADEFYELSEGAEKLDIDAKIQNGQRELFLLKLPAGYDVVLKPLTGTSLPFFQSLVVRGQEKQKFWESELEIKGHCSRPISIELMISHLNTEELEGLSLQYEIIPKELCCDAGLVVEENPEAENLNGQFAFDYYIDAVLNYNIEGETRTIPLKYFVNSKDGSMLFTDSWFFAAFGRITSRGKEAHAAIWFPNGQVVVYVLDRNSGQKLAITIDLNQRRNEIMGIQAINAAELVRLGPNSGISPAPIPHNSPWNEWSSGIALNQPERYDPSQINKISAYLSDEEYPISSPLSSFGFLVGYIRDANNKNKQLVYQKVELPGGDMYEAHLIYMGNFCAQFDGGGYKKMTIGSSTGAIAAMTAQERAAFSERQNELHEQRLMLLQDLQRCRGNKSCEAEISKLMMDLERELQDNIFDLPANPEFTGNAASEFQSEQRAIRDDMHRLQEELIDLGVECERKNRMHASCDCMDIAVENCRRNMEDRRNMIYALECRLARLQGMDHLYDDCPR